MKGELEHGDLTPQYAIAFLVNAATFGYGVMIGWMAPMQPLLQANYTGTNETSPFGPGAEPMSDEEISWVPGMFCIGGILGGPIYGYLTNVFGRKKVVIMCAVPFVVAYGLFLMATSQWYIFIGRFIAGLAGGGLCVAIPMYIGEIAETAIRGILGSFLMLITCAGIVGGYIVGSYTSYTFLSYFGMSWALILLAGSYWIPETPIYSLLQNRTEEAYATLRLLRGNHKELIERELRNLSASVKEMTSNEDTTMSLAAMLRDPATRKGLIIGVGCMGIQQFSGIAPIINYLVVIFEASGSTMSPHIATIIVGFLQFAGALIATLFMDRAGRKFFLYLSSVGMTVTLALIAYFFYLKEDENTDEETLKAIGWLPVTSMAVYIVVFAVGYGAVSFVLVTEMFRAEARSTATSICILANWFFSFLLLKFFAKLQDTLGAAGCFALFAIFCILGFFFAWFYVIETKGKSLERILWELGGSEDMALTDIKRSSPVPLVVHDEKRDHVIHFSLENGKLEKGMR